MENTENKNTDDTVIDRAAVATHQLILKMKTILEDYVNNGAEGETFEVNTRHMIAARAISGHAFIWMTHVQKLLRESEDAVALRLANLDTVKESEDSE